MLFMFTYAFKQTKPSLYPGAFVNFSQNANIKFSARSVGIYDKIFIRICQFYMV